jgi:TolB-like protein/Tfp pilus assembly protein PilF
LRYLFEDYALDTDRRELQREGSVLPLEPQVFDLLAYLVHHRDRVVSKDDLLAAIWNGRIVSESAMTTRINAARTAIGDNGETQRLIRTLRGRGIRFVASVREETVVQAAAEPARSLALPDRPSIAVLPFQNLSSEPDQEYFADGTVEEIITALSRIRWLFVIARNSSFTYKGRTADARQIGRELGVRYVLEGSVRKAADRVRITGQLIDASSGVHIWADRFDGALGDIFDLQEEITKKVVAAIEPKLLEAEGIRSQGRSHDDLGAWDQLIHANWLFWRLTKAECQTAIANLEQVIEHYPDYAPAHSMLAFAMLFSRHIGWTSMEPQLRQAAALAARAAELDDRDPWTHLALGYVAFARRLTNEAVEEFQRALDLNPNFAAAHGYLGFALALDGRSGPAIEHIEQAIRMSPHDPQNAMFNVAFAAAHYQAGRYTEAVSFARKALQQRPGFPNGHRMYVACLAQAGRTEEAHAALARVLESHPETSVAWIEENIPYTPGPMAKFLEGMRKGGLQ